MITQEELKNILHYDPETGIFNWIVYPRRGLKNCIAGSIDDGYVRIKLNGKSYLAHRLAWLYIHGEFPTINLDHIDLNRSNNAISNLRLATQQENTCNVRRYKNNKSGIKGISWMKENNKWCAYVDYDKKRSYLGLFTDINEAEQAVRIKREELHKEFTNHG